MPARKRKTQSGGGGKIWSVIVIILALALALAFMRSNGITDFNGALHYFRGLGQDASEAYPRKVQDAIHKSCNFIKDPSCLYNRDAQNSIGDINHDGKVDDNDSREYAKENGVTLPQGGGNADNGGTPTPQQPNEDSKPNGTVSDDAFMAKLDALTISAPDTSRKYNRADYKHWLTIEGSCDAREESLKTIGFDTDAKTCKAKPGFNYVDPYTGKTITDPRKIDIDHLIPLGYVNQHGGASWSAEKKAQYANDVQDVLIPVDASANRQKGDKGPASWMPENKTYHCQYARKWVDIASKYGISITQADKTVLKQALSSCSVGK